MDIITTDHTAFNVTDVEVSRDFYTNKLGLPEMDRPNFDFGGVWYKTGPNGEQFHLISNKDMFNEELAPPPKKPRTEHHVAFRVADIDAARKELVSRGVEIILDNTRPDGVHQVFVMDPDGYTVEFNNYTPK